MSNWFESNPVRSIIIYSIVLVGTTWAIYKYLYEDRVISLYKAQIESVNTELSQYKAKLELEDKNNIELRSQNQQYLKWLEANDGTFPFLIKANVKIGQERDSLTKELGNCNKDKKNDTIITKEVKYDKRAQLSKGETFLDDKTNIIIGLSDISYENEAKIMLTLPNEQSKEYNNIKPGYKWVIKFKNINYSLFVTKVSWIAGYIEVNLKE